MANDSTRIFIILIQLGSGSERFYGYRSNGTLIIPPNWFFRYLADNEVARRTAWTLYQNLIRVILVGDVIVKSSFQLKPSQIKGLAHVKQPYFHPGETAWSETNALSRSILADSLKSCPCGYNFDLRIPSSQSAYYSYQKENFSRLVMPKKWNRLIILIGFTTLNRNFPDADNYSSFVVMERFIPEVEKQIRNFFKSIE